MGQLKEDIGTRKDLALYRLQTARSDLKSARILLAAEEYKGANNRAYYAIFHAINAIHALSEKLINVTKMQSEILIKIMIKNLIKVFRGSESLINTVFCSDYKVFGAFFAWKSRGEGNTASHRRKLFLNYLKKSQA